MSASDKPIHRLRYTPDGKALAVFSLDYSMGLIELSKLKYRSVKPEHDGACFNGDLCHNLIASLGCDGYLNIIELKGAKPGEPLARHQVST